MSTDTTVNTRTVPGIGPGSWDSGKLAREQELQANTYHPASVLYRLYTEDISGNGDSGIAALVARYFDDATIYASSGVWQGAVESGLVIDIIATRYDIGRIRNLAEDIRVTNHQTCVLVTWHAVNRLDVVAP